MLLADTKWYNGKRSGAMMHLADARGVLTREVKS